MTSQRILPGRIASTVFRLALRAFPLEFRERFADSMMEAFEDGYAERTRFVGGGRTAFVVRATASVLWTGIVERFKPAYGPHLGSELDEGMMMRKFFGMLAQDFAFAARSMRKRPGFSLVAIATLALGVGANSTIFSVVNGVLLKPLPYPDSGELVAINANYGGELGSMSYPDIVDIAEQAPSIQSLVGQNTTNSTLTGLGDPEVIRISRVTEGLMETFRMSPAMGRDVRADEFGADGPRVALISDGFWRERFGADADVLGETFQLNGNTYEVVGVAPAEFDYPSLVKMWIPRRLDVDGGCGRACHTMRTVGRLVPGATVEMATAEVNTVALNLEAAFPESNTGKGLALVSLQDYLVGSVESGLQILLGAVALVLLIACVNVANLLLVRASARSGELAVRTALGASRARLISQSLVESFTLATVGGVVGLALAAGALGILPALAGSAIPRLEFVEIDGVVMGFSFGVIVVITALFGLAPALTVSRVSLRSGVQSQRDDGAPAQQRFRSWLLAGEVALSALLLIGAGLLMRTFQELYSVDVGYEMEDRLRFNLNLPFVTYPTIEDAALFYRSLEEEIRAIPGVVAAGSIWAPPLGRSHASGTVTVEGRPEPAVEDEVEAAVHSFGPGSLEMMGIQVLRGRGPTANEERGLEAVVLLNEELARRLFPNEDPLGQVLESGMSLGYSPVGVYRIVGILEDVRMRDVRQDPEPEMWIPHGVYGPGNMTVTVHTAAGAVVMPEIRELVRSKNPNLPLYRVETMQEAMTRQVAPTRFYMVLAVAFAALAAVLAAVGLYGVVAYSVSRRTREIGLRVALGADGAGIVRLILGQGVRPALWGLFVGLIGAFFAGNLLQSVIFGVDTRDPLTFIGTGVLLALVSGAATALPARRATRVDPVVALRAD